MGGQATFHEADVTAIVHGGRAALASSLGASVTFGGANRRARLVVSGRLPFDLPDWEMLRSAVLTEPIKPLPVAPASV
ncbi:hypothetical protein WCLP8_5600001 [uncultured Gammaproteobacteria bacterium]